MVSQINSSPTKMILNDKHTSEPISKCPNDSLCSQKVLKSRLTSEPFGKCKNKTSCSKEKSLPSCTPVDLLGLGVHQLVQRHLSDPPRKSIPRSPVPSRGETARIPKRMVLEAARNTLPIPSRASKPQAAADCNHPDAMSWWQLCSENSISQLLRELILTLAPKSVSKSESSCS